MGFQNESCPTSARANIRAVTPFFPKSPDLFLTVCPAVMYFALDDSFSLGPLSYSQTWRPKAEVLGGVLHHSLITFC